jgi:hypothetical protein
MIDQCVNVSFSVNCLGCIDCFGCNGLRKKQYCILNKKYDKETYFKIRNEIIKNMNENPYIDNLGRVWKYGEYLPYDLSDFDYNESFAIQHFPLEKNEALSRGFKWCDIPKSEYEVTMNFKDLPDDIEKVSDTILKEMIGCALYSKAYKILSEELNLLRRFNLPLPRLCPDCRHMNRLKK